MHISFSLTFLIPICLNFFLKILQFQGISPVNAQAFMILALLLRAVSFAVNTLFFLYLGAAVKAEKTSYQNGSSAVRDELLQCLFLVLI